MSPFIRFICCPRRDHWVAIRVDIKDTYGPYKSRVATQGLCNILNEYWAKPSGSDKVERERAALYYQAMEFKKHRGVE